MAFLFEMRYSDIAFHLQGAPSRVILSALSLRGLDGTFDPCSRCQEVLWSYSSMNCERVWRAERGLGCALRAQCDAFLDSSSWVEFAADTNAFFIVLFVIIALIITHMLSSLKIPLCVAK